MQRLTRAGQVVTARDFSMIFDAYAQFEESMITAKMEVEEESDDDSDEEEGDDVELEMRLARLEHLMDRRPELFSSVKYDYSSDRCALSLICSLCFAQASPKPE